MIKKLVATDMDGTFLDDKGDYDKVRFARLLDRLAEQDTLFAAASGRQLLALEAMFADFSDRIVFVAENGGIVKYQGKVLFEEQMPFDKVLEIVDVVRNSDYIKGDAVLLSGAQGSYIFETASDYYKKKANFYYENVQELPDFSGVTDDILKLTVNFSAEKVLEGEAWVNAQVAGVRAVTTGFESIDIIPEGISKATGLRHIAEKFTLTPSDITAFGDNLNDLEMLDYAGHAIATANARDEIKAISDDIIGHHKDAAVLSYLETHLI
ncbi:Cof-type HAD-IIB family hydrolase [Lactococcus insecticola]|uniref:Haloacid dehalogenase n=1 Tax=Pseudolactococcus insecticola TaxID=2709158 RepID=A0A6A0B9H2_9LACT|nr:Cof-type HAD-IIB family hydrolase [Lactococcus insecticola]GFH40467.1 haloacid dehalogenase [Lactococcus insecticola]